MAIQTRKEIGEMLNKGGFTLRKYASNQLEVLRGLSENEIGVQSVLQFNKDETVKTLGICWEPEKDRFVCNVAIREHTGPLTKRVILSGISQLYDPLGLISPIVIRGKMLMQKMWLQSGGWDDQVPKPIAEEWKQLLSEIPLLQNFCVDRYAFLPEATIQLHVFSDASETAYGACVYARSLDGQGNIKVQLIASKSRVCPLKRVTLPRLELCAADLAAGLHSKVCEALQMEIEKSFFWSDSTVALQWIKAPANCWKTFVANRVSNIQSLTKGDQWNHVAGSQNPADYVSRGMSAETILRSCVWKSGPDWLASPPENWPKQEFQDYPSNGKERRKVIVAVAKIQNEYNSIITRYSSYIRLTRITALCLLFISRCRKQRPDKDIHIPTTRDLALAEMRLVKLAQADDFHQEFLDLKKGKSVSLHSSIRMLNPFLDEDNIIRVGGRLRLSEQPYLTKHPVLMSPTHPLTRRLIIHYHLKLVHAGGRLTFAAIREKYWIINGKRTVRSIMRSCFRCARANPVPEKQMVGQLPAARVVPNRPFAVSGVDYAGPVYLKPVHRRAESAKAYIGLFVCFVTKAVHIELVGDLSTASFLCALRRFIGRRGPPSDIYSDNGKNFEGANNELLQLKKMMDANSAEIHGRCANKGINWHFSPPKAPHFGGLWEAAVKVAKKHLRKQLGNSRLSFEDMTTLLVEIESAMNSRPLVPFTEDPNDLACLTPGHFLIGTSMHSITEPDYTAISAQHLDHYQSMQRVFQQFWHQWRTEYLHEMQKKHIPQPTE